MDTLARYLPSDQAQPYIEELLSQIDSTEFAVVKNLGYVYAPTELYPLAPKVTDPLPSISAFAVDMDGTSTTTEPLALHALEYMTRRFTNRMTPAEWAGLDEATDHPFVIGNSNFRHTEFLLHKYADHVNEAALRRSFFEALLWTLSNMEDIHRLNGIRLDAVNCGIGALLSDPEFLALAEAPELDEQTVAERIDPFIERYGSRFKPENDAARVSAALDIYYMRYHAILRRIERGEGAALAKELLGSADHRLVEPMPGYGVFVALIKGWLGSDAANLAGTLRPSAEGNQSAARLGALGRRFAERPAKLALVTASIAYEAHAVVKEVFAVVREQVAEWPIPTAKKEELVVRFSDYRGAFDGFVTATDSSEARLKPHRDLFSIALYQMSIPKLEYPLCVGLEDTEPGIISLRAAGVGCAVAMPNRDTQHQNYRAAAHVISDGLPELILDRNLLLRD